MAAGGLFYSMLVFAVADWAASWQKWRVLRMVTKPGTLILLIAWFSLVGGWQGALVWFGLGLGFSLLGDIFLMGPKRLFLAGMAAFFLAHCAYIVGFAQEPLVISGWLALPVIGIAGVCFLFLRVIRAGLRRKGEIELFLPASAYAAVLSLTLLFAISTFFRPGWMILPALLASTGAGLFFISDAVLAYNRFVRSHPLGDLVVMTTYHMAQILISGAALIQYAL